MLVGYCCKVLVQDESIPFDAGVGDVGCLVSGDWFKRPAPLLQERHPAQSRRGQSCTGDVA